MVNFRGGFASFCPRQTKDDVTQNIEMREQGLVLRNISDPATFSRDVDSCGSIEKRRFVHT